MITFGRSNATAYNLEQLIKTAESTGTAPAISYTNSVNETPLTSTASQITLGKKVQPKKLTVGKMLGTTMRAVFSYPFAKMATSVLRGVSGAKHIQLGQKKIPLNFNFKQYLGALLAIKAVNTVSHNAAINTGLNVQA